MSATFEPTVDPNDTHRLTEEEQAGLGARDPVNQLASTSVEIHCPHCGRDHVMQSAYSKGMCVDCYQALANRNTTLYRHGDPDWKAKAQKEGIALYERLPQESQRDYEIFKTYMMMYPLERPTLKKVAERMGLAYGTVTECSMRCHFKERLDAWMRECDKATLLQRRTEMIEMNSQHIKMATTLRSKLLAAMNMLEPGALKPTEIAQLAKLANSMEREARIDQIAQEEMRADLTKGDENPDLKKSVTKAGDLGEVLSVLMKSGALGDAKSIGVRMSEDKHGHKTQELVVQAGDPANGIIETDYEEVTDVGEE